MEGRGKSRRRNTRQEWKRRLSSALAVVLTAAMVLNMPLSIDSLGLHVSNAFASGSNADREGGLWATASNAKYQKGQSQDVDIYVIAEDNEAAPGNTSSMTLYLKNNTGQTITEGTLSFKGNHIAKEDGYFEDMGTAQADSPTVIVGGEDPTKQTEASGEGMLYQEDGEDSKESIDSEASLGDQDGIAGGDDADADEDANDADDEDAEEEESHKLTDIDLQPGEMREIRFTYYTDDEENSTKAYVEFSFHGEDENEAAVRSSSKFYYSIGLPFVNFSMEDGMQIESGVSNDMEIWMSEPTWVDEALEERIEKQEEEEAEKAYRDEETEPADIASGSNADKASDSNASKDTEDTDTQKDQDKINQYKEEAMTISKVSYDVEIYGAELERFSPRKAEEVEDLGWISCIYEVANNTEPGVYYGKVTANGRWNNRKFTSEQGFLFEVTGEGKTGQEFTKELDKVIVHAYAEEGVLEEGVKLTVEELAKGSEPFSRATEGLDNGDVQYDENNMLAFDICFVNKNGEEVEPNGDVQVSIEMKKDALPEDIDLETVEVHHIKEFDDTVEAEPVADGADKTDGTVKSAEVAVAELKKAEVDQEEIEAAVSDEAVAVAEFSVGSFSTFTITWGGNYRSSSRNLYRITEDGSKIGTDKSYSVRNNSNNWLALNELATNYDQAGIYGYNFLKAVIADKDTNSSDVAAQGIEISNIRYSNGWYYRTNNMSNGNGTKLSDDEYVYLVYEKDTSPVRVYVYVAGTGLSDECLTLLGIDKDTLDSNGYFPAGEISLDASYFEGKSSSAVNTPGVALINSASDWAALVEALGEMDTSTLVDQRNWNYSGATAGGKKDYSVNQDNHVGDYLDQARGDIGYTWGSQRTALFRWHNDPSERGNAHYGFEDQSVKYHLDLMFTTNTIKFVLGNNGISSGIAKDGKEVDSRTYITGSEIQPPRNLNIPEGYYLEGYYKDKDFTESWDRIGQPLLENETVYIKLSKTPVLTLTITKEVIGNDDVEQQYSFYISTKSQKVSGKTYQTSQGEYATFPETPDVNENYTATVTMNVSHQNGFDGVVIISGLPTGEGVTYTITEDMGTAEIEGYNCEVSYTIDGKTGNVVTTGADKNAITEATIDVTNTYTSHKILTIEKTVTGNMGYTNETFAFTLTLTKDGNPYTADLKRTGGDALKANSDRKYTFDLKHGGSIALSIPAGVEYTITEAASGYDTFYWITGMEEEEKTETKSVTGTLNDDTTVKFRNEKNIASPTGFFTDNLPYMMMLAIATIGATGSLYPAAWKKRKKSREK